MPSHLFHYLLKKQSSMEKSVLGTLSNTRHTAGKKGTAADIISQQDVF